MSVGCDDFAVLKAPGDTGAHMGFSGFLCAKVGCMVSLRVFMSSLPGFTFFTGFYGFYGLLSFYGFYGFLRVFTGFCRF